MGRIRVIARLVARDLRRRRGEAVLMLITIMAASAALTLGLILHGVTSQPYAQTRAATRGPDVVANVFPNGPHAPVSVRQMAELTALDHARGVTAHSGPYPVTWALLRAHGITASAQVEGRDEAAAPVDQPKLTQGSWVRPGEVVIERSFADALGVGAGARITLNGRPFRVAGVAVTAAFPPYPEICSTGCIIGTNQMAANQPGLVWTTRAAARGLATTAEPLTYFLNLKLAHPGSADAFASAHNSPSQSAPSLIGWQDISQHDANVVQKEQLVMMVASWLLCLLAVASVAVLVAGRVADQIRRVGLLKAVGATPGLVAMVFLAEYLVLALLAAALGLAVGRLVAPLLTSAGAGLLGTAGAPPMTLATVGVVAAVALAVAAVADALPRGARGPDQHRARPGGRGPAAAAPGLAGRDLRAAAGLVAARPAAGRPPAAPGPALGVQRGRHGQRDRRGPDRARPRRPEVRCRLHAGRPEDRAAQRGADGLHRGAGRPGRGQRAAHHLGDGGRRAALVGGGTLARRHARARSAPGCPGRRCCPRWPGPCSASRAASGWSRPCGRTVRC